MYVAFRRKREKKTNYKKRYALLKSKKNRIVIRKTNRYIIIQLIKYNKEGDEVLLGLTSKELKKIGWNKSFKNKEAAYLTGYLFGLKALNKGYKEGIIDLGLQNFNNKTGKLAAAIKGIKESGFNINVGFDLDKVKLEDIEDYKEKIKEII